jgi:lycopene elongase/hydratase (dihydrobisanhydrobacterioruberin-forming)
VVIGMDIKRIIKVSRPRFWLYLAGTYMVGYAFGMSHASELLSIHFILPFIIFMIPANIFIYGINDMADREADAKNPKKDDVREARAKEGEITALRNAVLISALLLLPILPFVGIAGAIMLIAFIVLGAGYSIEPLRFKSKPFIDFLSNSFYILPGMIGYHIASGSVAPVTAWILGLSWTGAMHLFSAIPDINPDRKAGIMTTAVLLGTRMSIKACIILWGVFVLSLIVMGAGYLIVAASLVYIIIPIFLLFSNERNIIRAYWYYPYINGIMGMIFFFYAMIPKI